MLPFLRSLDEILDCHHLSGDDSFLIRAAVESIPALEELVRKLSEHGQTATSLILSSPISEYRQIPPPALRNR
ncbi:MAG: Lrp/AsnC ligand binding domain-containing protein [Bryobacteraceae bacterium]